MKLLVQSAMVTILVLALGLGLYAQRIADWGEINGQGNQKAEFSWSRLSYTTAMGAGGYGGYGGFGGGYGRGWGATWSRDYPKADRQFLMALNRLTRIEGRNTEQVVSPDSDDIFNYPFVYAVMVHTWSFNDDEAKRMREYLLKGGFLMVDDFHGTQEWEDFMTGIRQIFPDANKYPVEDLSDKDEIFHVLYDMDDRFQVPGEHYVRDGQTYEMDGYVANGAASATSTAGWWWRSATTCIWAMPGSGPTIQSIPERFASMAFRVGLNYVMYSMTH